MDELQKRVHETFKKYFGRTPLKARLKDIQRECVELVSALDMIGTKDEMGDLLCSLLAGASECGWDVIELIENSLNKIKRRELQYLANGRKIQVALYGGSFDPIHLGHLEVAKFVLKLMDNIDEVWFTPCYISKYGKVLASEHTRLAMCELATKKDGRLKVFYYEINHKLSGETYHFFNKLLSDPEYKDQYSFCSIVGADTVLNMPEWGGNSEYLTKMIPHIILPSKDTNIPLTTWFLKDPNCTYIEPENTKYKNVSSTTIRNLVENKTDFIGFLKDRLQKYTTKEVADYAIKNSVYAKKD